MKTKRVSSDSLNDDFQERIIDWTTFYRRNIHRFIEHYFGIHLYFFQKILVYLMNLCPQVVIVCSRAVSKSFTTSVYACAVCVLYPGSKVLVTAMTKKQAGLLITEKIEKELMVMSPNLKREIKTIKTGQNAIEVVFHNGSSFIAGVAGEQSRGLRSTVLITDEFRLVKKDVLDSILIPTEIQRQPKYTMLPQYEKLKEEPREIYLSSAYYKSHWMWKLIKDTTTLTFKNKAMIFATDLATTLKHGIKSKGQLVRAKQKSDSATFDMEYNNLMIGGSENQYYSFELVSSCQTIKKAWYPITKEDYISKRKLKIGNIEKQDNEIRIVCMDIAVSESTKKVKNDNSVIKCVRALLNGNKYERQEVYTETFQGMDMDSQAIRARQILEDFKGDVFCFDARTYGTIMTDSMAKTLYDEERDKEYPPISVFNNQELANRCKNKNASPIMWAYIGSADNNHKMHTYMKSALIDGKYKMLINSMTCVEEYLDENQEYKKASLEQKALYELPYMQSDLTLNEMINLNQEFIQGSKIKLTEPSTGTKDRYITSAMANLYIQEELEVKLTEEEEPEDWSGAPSIVTTINF